MSQQQYGKGGPPHPLLAAQFPQYGEKGGGKGGKGRGGARRRAAARSRRRGYFFSPAEDAGARPCRKNEWYE